jgi:hypothetical protein
MSHRGDIRLEDTIDVKFTTRRFTTGAPFALSGGVISAYVGNSTTQITAGITLSADFDGVTGLNNVRVVATAANGYTAATNVDLVITTGTVDSVSVVGEVIGSFSIEARSALMPTTVARKLDVSATGEAGIDWANIGSPSTAQNLSGTNIDVDQVVASVSGAVGSVTGAVGSVTGAVGSVTGNVGGNVTGSVGSVAAGGIAAASFAANAINASKLDPDVTTELQAGLATQTSVDDLPTNAELATALGTADDAVLTAINDLPTNAELATALGTADDAVLAQIALVKTETDKIASIKTKTDSLTFTKALELDVNLQSVNGTTITGDGQSGSEWGPA